MYRIIIILYSLSIFSRVNCNLDKEEGAACEWEGVKGTCVNSHRCLTTLDDKSPKQPICSQKDGETIICCTDCELVNDTRDAVISPTFGLYWKTGEKARDKCLDYLKDLPYECHRSYYYGLSRELDEEKKCHRYKLRSVGGPPPIGSEAKNKYPYMVLLGYGEHVDAVQWLCGGSIISDKYILTSAHCTTDTGVRPLKYVAYGILSEINPTEEMKRVAIKRIIKHPKYKPEEHYNDIALIELDTPITFNENVLPACLQVSPDVYDDDALVSTRRNPQGNFPSYTFTAYLIPVMKYGEKECSSQYNPVGVPIPRAFDKNTQLCYGEKEQARNPSMTLSGEPLLIRTQFSWCFYTIIGLMTDCGYQRYDVYTKVLYYVPWIESIVWP